MSDILFQPLGDYQPNTPDLAKLADLDPRLTRTHYFDGRLLKAEDLTRDQTYLDGRLRELGRVLGSGIMSGLELRLTGDALHLQPGQALTAAGRVLELGKPLQVSLANSSLRQQLNDGSYRYLDRGLYAVILRQLDVHTDVAEVFPQDLGSQRGSQYAQITECVQLALARLQLPLPPGQNPLQIRAQLMAALYDHPLFDGLIPEDAVTLGLLAVENNSARWLDSELLRRPLRGQPALGDSQADLSRRYEILLEDILRQRGSQRSEFRASDYFPLLPPVGSLPRDAIDPAAGRHSYFPEHFQVSIAPVRLSDVAQLKAESLQLPPLNLRTTEPVDIMVLVPLPNQMYGQYAARLESPFNLQTRRLPQVDPLRLQPYRQHLLDKDETAWRDIMTTLGNNLPFYVRRPSRAAETAISGIVLARGASLPPDEVDEPSPADSGGLIQDENSVFLQRLNLSTLSSLRPPQPGASRDAFVKLTETFAVQPGRAAPLVSRCTALLLRIERQYDSLVWQTLLQLAEQDQMDSLLHALLKETDTATARVIRDTGSSLGLDSNLLNQWADLVP